MRAWTRGEKIGCVSLLVGGVTCLAVILSTVQSVRRAVGAEAEGPSSLEGPGSPITALLEEQRKLLAEETASVRAELRRLHDERIALRRDRIEGLARRFEKGERREYDRILLSNHCREDVAVTLYYHDLDEHWITRGWWMVPPGETVTTDAMTRNAYVYIYAENQATGWKWSGSGKEEALELPIVDERFDHIEGDRFVWPDPRTVSFYRIHTGDAWSDVTEEFECLVEAPP
jgi:hypothetical protein